MPYDKNDTPLPTATEYCLPQGVSENGEKPPLFFREVFGFWERRAMEERACCFTGHRVIRARDRERLSRFLDAVLDELLRRGINTFLVGGALGFDTLAALAVLERKKEHPRLRLVLAIPCQEQTRGWRASDVAVYNQICSQADEVRILASSYYSGCMHARNRYMVDRSEICVAYRVRESGGTDYTVRYAKEQGRRIFLYREG